MTGRFVTAGTLYRLAAFAEVAGGGNPAGVWVGDELPEASSMQEIAADVGFSETAFVAPASGLERVVRYYSPAMEVPFCGHATIATGAVLGGNDGEGSYRLATSIGIVPVRVSRAGDGFAVSLESVTPAHKPVSADLLAGVLSLLSWPEKDLDGRVPPALAYAGAWHLVIAVTTLERLNELTYDFDALQHLMLQHELVTLQLVFRESDALIHSRNPFPVGGVVEDPATGAAAAALGGYLRDAGILSAPTRFRIRQGEAMGRPSVIDVAVPTVGGVTVTGRTREV